MTGIESIGYVKQAFEVSDESLVLMPWSIEIE